jgi:hypothetical protein
MFEKRWKIVAAAVAVAVTTGLAGCDDGADAELETTPPPATGDVTPTDELDVAEVRLGRVIGTDLRITDEVTEFAPGDSVHASVRLDGTATSATLMARWTTESDSLLHEETQTVASTGEQWTTFSFATPSLPAGDYELKILLNGTEVEEREFSIDEDGDR